MYTIHQTKTNLSKILKEVVEEGKEAVIARGDTPIAKIVRIDQPVRRKAGSLKGILEIKPGFFDPMTKEELREWGIE